MSNVTFQTGEQRDMAQRMVNATNVYLDKLDEIKTKMTEMGNYWEDAQYDGFMGVFDEEYARLSALQEDLNAQVQTVNVAADDGDQTVQNINNIING